MEELKSQNFNSCVDDPVIVNTAFSYPDISWSVGGSKNFKLSAITFFGVSFQKNVFSSFLLFSSVCYQDDLSDSERNEIASLTARNFNNN